MVGFLKKNNETIIITDKHVETARIFVSKKQTIKTTLKCVQITISFEIF